MTIFTFMRAPFIVLLSFLGIWMTRTVVGALAGDVNVSEVLTAIAWLSVATLAVNLFHSASAYLLMRFQMLHMHEYTVAAFNKALNSDYDFMESPEGQNGVSKAFDEGVRGVWILGDALPSLLTNILGAASFAVIIWTLSPWVLIAVAAATLAGFAALKQSADWVFNNKDKWKNADRKMNYLFENYGDFTRAKDIRLYTMADWLGSVFGGALKERLSWAKKEEMINFRADVFRAALSLIRESVAYGSLVYLVYARNMSAADFILYFGVIGGISVFLNGVVGNLNGLNRFHLGMCEFRAFVDREDKANRGRGADLPNETFTIEFNDVCYRYAGGGEDAIKNLSFKIKKGEKLAIVGVNGAGKTTIVKLICGLYAPTSGKVLLNGVPIEEFNREEYYKLFSAVFQDIFIMPESVACNVSSLNDGEFDREKVERVLELAGLGEKIRSLPRGHGTRLVKSVYDDAVDFSGGEAQKLTLARALYKNGFALILDEPTAALDPIAESRVYEEYNRMSEGRTSMFISHRLASTRFCDRIILLEDGRIAEEGSHDELMALSGKYGEMFEIQSHYYKSSLVNGDTP